MVLSPDQIITICVLHHCQPKTKIHYGFDKACFTKLFRFLSKKYCLFHYFAINNVYFRRKMIRKAWGKTRLATSFLGLFDYNPTFVEF